MRFRFFHLLALLLIFLLIFLLSISMDQEAQAAQGASSYVRIPQESVADLAALELAPRFEQDYGAYVWLELDQPDYDRLVASQVIQYPAPLAGQISVPGYRFDPQVDGPPELPPALQLEEQSQASLRLVQFKGPVRDAWLAALKAQGLQVLQYYPHNAYLVWGTAAQAQALNDFPPIRWQGLLQPAYKLSRNLNGLTGRIQQVEILFYPDGDPQATLQALASLGASLVQAVPAQPDRMLYQAIVEIDAGRLADVASLPYVLWLGYLDPVPRLDDEVSAQIVLGNHPGGVPYPGYQQALADLGYDGSGVIWSITDTGVDYDHPDLNIVGGYAYPGAPAGDGPGDDCEFGGHGTHVAGILGGDASAGYQDGNGFLYGLGVAPAAGIFAQNPICGEDWPPVGGWQELSKQAVLGGALGSNNSWTSGEGTRHGYQLTERIHDFITRDANFDTASQAEPFIQVFSAGNSGSSGVTAPKEAKNLIVVASSLNYRAGDIDQMASSSSQGPAVDGRWVPTLTAPGAQVASTRNDLGGICATPIPGTAELYAFCSGTSMAAPHVSGALALVGQWWRATQPGPDLSPAMAKALLVNAAVDMGDADIPNIYEGWGRLQVANVISPALGTVYFDQEYIFDNPGEQWLLAVQAVDPDQPLKLTLAWSDAPGAVEAQPALVNDLDLVLQADGLLYWGNQFENGWSVPGGASETLNNLENIFVPAPGSGIWTVIVQATNLPGDGVPLSGDATDQDFALVCQNCQVRPDFTVTAIPLEQAVCAPQPALYQLQLDSILGFSESVTLTLPTPPGGAAVSFDPDPVVPPGSSELTLAEWLSTPPGYYDLAVVAVAATSTHTVTLGLELFTALPGTVDLIQPVDGATQQDLRPEFTWQPASQAVSYTLELAADPAFDQLVYRTTLTATHQRLPLELDFETRYYWRVTASNPCGPGLFSGVNAFTTKSFPNFLLVDDDGNLPDMQAIYTTTLEAAGIDALVWDTQAGDYEPALADLLPFDTILWYSAAQYGGQAGPSVETEQALTAWLSAGKCLLLSSQDYLHDRGLSAFARHQLGVAGYLADHGQSYLLPGSGMLAAWPGSALNYPFASYADVITPTQAADTLLWGNQGGAAVYQDNLQGKTAFLAFPFEAIPTLLNRTLLLDDLASWCQQATGQLTGFVRAAPDEQGLPAVSVTAQSDAQAYQTVTNAQGAYTLTLPVGLYTVTAQAAYYISQTLSAVDMMTATASQVDFELAFDAYAGFDLSPNARTRSGLPGEVVPHTFTLRNTGSLPDRYTWVTHDYLWSTTPTGQTGMLGPGESEIITVTVTVPAGLLLTTPLPSADDFTLTATSENYSGYVQHAFGTTYAGVQAGVALTGASLAMAGAGETVTHTLVLTNTGNYTDTYHLHASGVAWASQVPQQIGPLAPGAATSFAVTVTLPDDYPPIRDRFDLSASSEWDELVTASAPIETRFDVQPGIILFPSTQKRYAVPGQTVIHTVRFTNYGDVPDSYHFKLSGNRWPTYIQGSVGPLAPGEMITVEVPVQVPAAPWPDRNEMLSDAFQVQINSALDPELVKYSYGTTELTLDPAASVQPADPLWQVAPGEILTGTLLLTNTAPHADRLRLSLQAGQWPVTLVDQGSVRLAAGESTTLEIVVQAPAAAALGQPADAFTLTVRSGWTDAVLVQATVQLALDVTGGVSIDLPSGLQALVGTDLLQPITLTNTGNYTDAFTITLDSAWPAALSAPNTGWLAIGASAVVTLELQVPLTAADLQVAEINLSFQSAHQGQMEVRVLRVTARWHKIHAPVLFR
ncbi:MAG: S8 family serine peptidase [Anaerolineales bacterium]|nr:S8 family serine peptidase [Anaerolineales bacterium]